MPGGYGTDESTPWGSAGTSYVTPGQSSSSYQSGAGSTNQGGSNAVADAINKKNQEQKYKQSSEYLNNPDNFSNAQEQYAASLLAYNKKYGVAGGGVGLGSSGAMFYTNVPDVYFSTYPEGTTGHSPTGFQKITGPGLLSINGVPISGGINRSIYNPYGGGGGGGGGGGCWGGYGGYGGYGGGGGGYGGGAYYDSPSGMPQGLPGERWGAQNPLQQLMIMTHGGPRFRQGFHRGGIVTLVED